jgi:hypothetical protein
MRRKTAVLVLTLALVAVPALGAPGATTDHGSSWSWSGFLSGLVDQVVEWIAAADEVEPDGDDEGGPWVDPDGLSATEPEPPSSEGGPWIDPNG